MIIMENEIMTNLDRNVKSLNRISWLYWGLGLAMMTLLAWFQTRIPQITSDGTDMNVFNSQVSFAIMGFILVALIAQWGIYLIQKRIAKGYHYKKTIYLKDLESW